MPQLAAGRIYCSSILDTLLYQVLTCEIMLGDYIGEGSVAKYCKIERSMNYCNHNVMIIAIVIIK